MVSQKSVRTNRCTMSRRTYHIRPAKFPDAVPIFMLIRSHPRELVGRSLSDIVQNVDRFFVAEREGKVVGTVSWQILPEIGAPKDPSIEIKSLAVEPGSRGIGIGRALVKQTIAHVRGFHPCRIILLTFYPRFFVPFGFRPVAKRSLMYKLYSGCINCSKYDSPFTCPEIAMALDLHPRHASVKRRRPAGV